MFTFVASGQVSRPLPCGGCSTGQQHTLSAAFSGQMFTKVRVARRRKPVQLLAAFKFAQGRTRAGNLKFNDPYLRRDGHGWPKRHPSPRPNARPGTGMPESRLSLAHWHLKST